MKPVFAIACALLLAVLTFSMSRAAGDSSPGLPHFAKENQMLPPDHYRDWVFLSSGYGMSYTPSASAAADAPFDNVFVNPPAYKSFLETGRWPDGATFVLEIRSSASKGSINQGGHFQQDVMAVEVHVRDEHRFPGGWAFYEFTSPGHPASPLPRDASCYSCHAAHGTVDTTFVQFYPTLIGVAKSKGTFKTPE